MKLRNYQQDAVDAALRHFRSSKESAVLVLPTGAGKSLVIAELARLARGRVLVLTHVKELVAQNADKVSVLTDAPGIFSAGLGQKQANDKTVVASVQSAARNPAAFDTPFSLVIIDECHRVSVDKDSQYQQLLNQLKQCNPDLLLLGLTATPYRLGSGFIYRWHVHGKVGNDKDPSFERCIFELPMRPLIKQGFLSPPLLLDGLAAQYDFSALTPGEGGDYAGAEVEHILDSSGRATTAIIKQLIDLGRSRAGVIIFAASVRHGEEILSLLEGESAALITADTDGKERDQLISAFKARQLKFLVNVAVLTTGFDAPHVDLIAILRPTASVSLFQQMVGRGLRIAEGKKDCLIIDYAANGYSLFYPEVGKPRPDSRSVPVQVPCPECGFANTFWGKLDGDGDILEHYGRRCQGMVSTEPPQQCSFRFRARICPDCGAENDVAARECQQCRSALVDPDKHLKAVLGHRHHHLFKVSDMQLQASDEVLEVIYSDVDGNPFKEKFHMITAAQRRALYALFILPHSRAPGTAMPRFSRPEELVAARACFRSPDLLLLKKSKYGWELVRKFFDYQGHYSSAARFTG
ncbi:DEAD/DEAH box helicase [Shewanella cyperi]|uniref:DEAD/DEAH box helicase n=1 Tax=Shewanella cyperi TaxID=2814292 RepID=A0A974XQ93_9GAMM|nr:DEAD/DEAH box helicase [Shewanella cyperi]QSX31438.1 DEAD/DEAH box helicase [Shewanella cyperi]